MKPCNYIEQILNKISEQISELKNITKNKFSSLLDLETALIAVYKEYEKLSEKFCRRDDNEPK